MLRVLFATSEAHPLVKTGGLADVGASLPRALKNIGVDITLILPAYATVLEKPDVKSAKIISTVTINGHDIHLRQTRLPGTRVRVLLVDSSVFSERGGNPYCGYDGADWKDNHWRFFYFCKVIELVATNQAHLNWQPDIVHCNDWQTGLVPALLQSYADRPATLFTIHNLAYRGLFPEWAFRELPLPDTWWSHHELEFYNEFSFIKGGLVHADKISTVSPSYANEIQTEAFGCGLEGLLQTRKNDLIGILNGIDIDEWNPNKDPYLVATYNRRALLPKRENKRHLQAQMALRLDDSAPLMGFVGRLVEQKGVDLVLAAAELLISKGCQLVFLGSGAEHYETALKKLATKFPSQVAVTTGYSEALAHQIEAGVDIFLMPSLFEPCGLNQMYSLRYGTLPIVHDVGGLRDTVRDESLGHENPNGFIFTTPTVDDFMAAVDRALVAFKNPIKWRLLQNNAMTCDLSWHTSAKEYVRVYEEISGSSLDMLREQA